MHLTVMFENISTTPDPLIFWFLPPQQNWKKEIHADVCCNSQFNC